MMPEWPCEKEFTPSSLPEACLPAKRDKTPVNTSSRGYICSCMTVYAVSRSFATAEWMAARRSNCTS